MAKDQNTSASAAAPAEEVKPTVIIQKTPISQEEYDQLKAQKEESDKKLVESEIARKQQDTVINSLKGMLKEASETTVKVVVNAGKLVDYQGKVYEATQASYWFKNQKLRPVLLSELTDEQKEILIQEEKLVEVQ